MLHYGSVCFIPFLHRGVVVHFSHKKVPNTSYYLDLLVVSHIGNSSPWIGWIISSTTSSWSRERALIIFVTCHSHVQQFHIMSGGANWANALFVPHPVSLARPSWKTRRHRPLQREWIARSQWRCRPLEVQHFFLGTCMACPFGKVLLQ